MASINISKTVRSLTGKYASWMVIFIGVLTSALIFWLEYRDNRQHWEKVFREDAGLAAVQLKKIFEVNEMSLLAFASFFSCSDTVTETEFRNFASPLVEKLKFVHGFGFLERVRPSERKKFEESSKIPIVSKPELFFNGNSSGSDFSGQGSEEILLPVRYLQLRKKNPAPFIGLDLSRGVFINSAPVESIRRGGPFIDSYKGVMGETSSVLIWYAPVFKTSGIGKGDAFRLEEMDGFIICINKIDDMIGLFINSELSRGVKLLVHIDEETDNKIIYGTKGPGAELMVKNSINVCGRKLLFTWRADFDYKGGIEINSAWLIAQFIVIITLFLVNMINIMRAYALRIEEEVRTRTQQLFNANQMLEKEIGFRRNVEADLIKTSLTATNILESMTEAFVSFDYEWNFTYVNPAAEKTLGIFRSEIIGKSFWTVFSESSKLKFKDEFSKVMKERVPASFEEYYNAGDLWLSVNAYPTLDGVSIYFTDVTGLKKNSRGDI